ncbi:gamma-interferon-inducible lysosomal thiol reductase-like [Haliotis rufescens]|uniref:gamma-interferon-inducible lysosomal thiol reductase-like n=1 Tax=Haliotis rufescens TaxID=6454 RepID=UPI001EB001EA|nr:gamma-interferon-inducible lysosomal thiol reductase-like [Haliotis rufescens]
MQVNIVLALMLCAVAGTLASECSLPPSLWCSSYEVAEACKVTAQCRRTVWSPVRGPAPLVNFTLYYESLCPDCRDFIKKQLFPAFTAVRSIFNLTLVPYGNAEEKKDGDKWVFDCQHGEEECAENLLDTCLLNIVNDINKAFPFIHCMEEGPERSRTAFRECAKKFPAIPADQIEACANSSQGNQWEHEMAMKTDALNPQHKYVPWVTLNGVHNEKIQNEAQNNLIKLLCDTYTGTKPSGCQQRRGTNCARK